MSTELAPSLVRALPWGEVELVEGTEAVLWPAAGRDPEDFDDLPDPQEGVMAVLSWVRPKILRFETTSPEPLQELLLVSTVAVGGPARFVVQKQYQMGTTAACDPPRSVHIVERRDLFRVPVATRVQVSAPTGEWALYSLDCSLGGLRICPPQPLEVGTEVDVMVSLSGGQEVALRAVVRHCRSYKASRANAPGAQMAAQGAGAPELSVVGLKFLRLPSDVERHLSQFVGYHQRRLMPRVQAVTPVEYRSHGRQQFLEAFAVEVSPGDAVVLSYEAHVPGDCMELKVRVGRQETSFKGFVLSCDISPEEEGKPRRYLVRVSFADVGDVAEAQFRKAVRDLAIEKVASRRS